MPIMRATELSFASAPRCPRCGVGLLPYGKDEPFAVDKAGQPYCRNHGRDIEPSYPEAYAEYRERLRETRLAAIRSLEEDAAPSAR